MAFRNPAVPGGAGRSQQRPMLLDYAEAPGRAALVLERVEGSRNGPRRNCACRAVFSSQKLRMRLLEAKVSDRSKSLTQLRSSGHSFTYFRLTFARHDPRIYPGCDLLCHYPTPQSLHHSLELPTCHLSTIRKNATKPSTSLSARLRSSSARARSCGSASATPWVPFLPSPPARSASTTRLASAGCRAAASPKS